MSRSPRRAILRTRSATSRLSAKLRGLRARPASLSVLDAASASHGTPAATAGGSVNQVWSTAVWNSVLSGDRRQPTGTQPQCGEVPPAGDDVVQGVPPGMVGCPRPMSTCSRRADGACRHVPPPRRAGHHALRRRGRCPCAAVVPISRADTPRHPRCAGRCPGAGAVEQGHSQRTHRPVHSGVPVAAPTHASRCARSAPKARPRWLTVDLTSSGSSASVRPSDGTKKMGS